jgi:hypothetical protein
MSRLDHEKLNRKKKPQGLHQGKLGRYNPVLDGKMPWGKHKFKRFADLPLDYLTWAVQNIESGPLRDKLDNEYIKRFSK